MQIYTKNKLIIGIVQDISSLNPGIYQRQILAVGARPRVKMKHTKSKIDHIAIHFCHVIFILSSVNITTYRNRWLKKLRTFSYSAEF